MSAGVFQRSKYQVSYGAGTAIHPIRLQPESIAATIGGTANDPPAGAQTNPISASVSRGKNQLGLRARFITLQAPTDTPPDGYKPGGITRIPALTAAFFNLAVKGATCVYLGVNFEVVSTSAESVK